MSTAVTMAMVAVAWLVQVLVCAGALLSVLQPVLLSYLLIGTIGNQTSRRTALLLGMAVALVLVQSVRQAFGLESLFGGALRWIALTGSLFLAAGAAYLPGQTRREACALLAVAFCVASFLEPAPFGPRMIAAPALGAFVLLVWASMRLGRWWVALRPAHRVLFYGLACVGNLIAYQTAADFPGRIEQPGWCLAVLGPSDVSFGPVDVIKCFLTGKPSPN